MATNDESWMREKLEALMPLIGVYVDLASLACDILIAADLIHAFRSKKLWLPSNYFSLNAPTLALLSVALKLPADITTNMTAATDRLAQISSLALTSTCLANFLLSLGSMSDGDVLINVTAVSILIATVAADVSIQILGTRSFLNRRLLLPEEILTLTLMLLLLLVLVSTAIMVPAKKKCLDALYQEKHNLADATADVGAAAVDRLRNLVEKYWVMAAESSPQLMIARSSACAAAGVICLINALTLAQAIVRTWMAHRSLGLTGSSYGSSTEWILAVQTVGVIFGTFSTSLRWFTAVRYRCSDDRSLRCEFEVDDSWTRKLVEFQECPIHHPSIRHHKYRRFLYNARGILVYLMLIAQTYAVLFYNLVLVISCCVAKAVVNTRADLPAYMLPKQVEQVLEASRRKKPSTLIEFLRASTFKGVADFDSSLVRSIHVSIANKNCWSLAVVTLTTIAVALPNVEKSKADQLVEDVRDGLFLVEAVEESFYSDGEWKNIRKAAEFWLRVDLFRKWQEFDLAEIRCNSRDFKHAVEWLAREGERIASGLKTDEPRIIAANAMYRIGSAVLSGCGDEESAVGDEEFFDRLIGIIADVLAACLANLERVISDKCRRSAIEEREKNVMQAALLLGRSEGILNILADRVLPEGLNEAAAAYVEEWRREMLPETEVEMVSSGSITPSEGSGSSDSSGFEGEFDSP
ncbi:uncharacterized protein LOC125195452 [Salvia hispanica]|uniref:uncharacterized protein LOC125195452 n=1 Tax=Salvia hispanica TaxID=49212 RepID=UPI002008F56F|nr:uncharacterized protein LOC125195452 [Salvia hispanica]